MEIAIAVAAKIAEYTVRPVGQWLCYSCHYKSNMENLKELEKTLRDAKNRVQHDVDAASNNGDEIEDDVKTWLTKVDGIIHQLATKKLGGGEEEAESRNSNASCLNLKQRHQISREAKEMVDNIAELLKKANFPRVSYRPPASQEMVTPRNMDYMTLDSRISITKRIMEALGDANINKIGVWGSPGVGKSTLMKEVFRKAKEESLFDEVALANVTNSPNLSLIQGEIADMLGLKLDPNITQIGRKANLRKRLEKDKEKKILVILDDIWKRLDLEEIGITPSERCKVLFTSRDRHVLASEMGTEENNFELDILEQEEAWTLFEKMAGDSVKHDLDLRKAAIEVAKACAGLPIALVTVSRALKNKRLSVWKDALVQLTRPTPEHDTEIWLPVYSCIQLSYENLVGRELKSLFLLCALQGYYISYRDLLRYGFGLCLFHDIFTLDKARNRLENLVCKLQDACLLLQSPRSSEEFYMHDHVRHVATIIALKHNMCVMRGDGGQKAWPDVDELERCEALSVHGGQKAWPDVDELERCEALSIHGGDHIDKFPNKIECPKLRYFHVQCNLKPMFKTPSSTSFQRMDRLEDIFFQGMERLEDIFFQGMKKLAVLSLTNIQLSSLFPLTNLQTLCLHGCKLGDIHWIGELKTLEILSLARSDISNLPGEIRSLTRLRLLDLTNCSKLRVIPLNVLSSLVKLEELYLRYIDVQWEVEGPNNEGKNASLAELKKLSHLTTLEIKIPDANNLPKDLFSEKLERYHICIGDISYWSYQIRAFSRSLHFKQSMSFESDYGIKMLLKRTEYLYLDDSNSTKSVFSELDREDFKKLKHLHIKNSWHLPELRISFKNLKVLEVENCEKLRFIFSSSIARGLSLLEELKITRCNNVGAIFVKEEEDHEIEEVFRRLQTLVLRDLPKLVSFLSPRETNSEGNHDLQLPLLHHQLSFPSLKNLHLQRLPKIKHVWSNVNGYESLKALEIQDCGVMEDIVAREDGTDPTTRLLFPSLTLLRLVQLPKLKWFFQGVRTLESSSSKELHEQGGTLFGIEEVSFPNLQTFLMNGLPKIKHIWRCGQEPKTVFRCIEQLKILEIMDCGVEEIVAGGGGGGGEPVTRTILEFPRVTDLRLIYLKRLKWFYKGVHVTKWPMLKKIRIKGCEKVEIFASGVVSFEETVKERSSEMSIKQPLFLVDEGEPHSTSFQKLRVLELENCEKLRFVFSSSIAKGLSLLEILEIKGCNNMGGIVVKEEKDGIEDGDVILFQQLQTLVLEGLPELVSFLSTRSSFMTDCRQIIAEGIRDLHMPLLHHQVSFPSLQTLRMKCLSKIKHVWSCGQELKTVWRCLEQLKILEIMNCGVEEIVAGGGGGGGEPVTRTILEFPRVTDLRLVNLKRLQWFYKGVHVTKWPMLEKISISGCEKVEIFASGVVSFEETVEERQSEMSIKQPLFLVDEGELHSTSFQKLRVLELENCEKFRFVFSSSIAKGLSLLEKLEIRRCNNMGAIVVKEEKDGIEDGDVILFQQLQTLVLEHLPELVSFLSTRSSFMTDCGQIIVEGNHDLHMPLLHHQVSFPSLQTLRMWGLPKIKYIWSCGQEPKTVCRCLEQLKILEIMNCGVEEIVAGGGGGGGEPVTRTILEFPRVTDLRLVNLKRLQWFYKGVHVTKWPMLEKISISGCEKVEIFASGVVSFEETVEERQSEMSIKQPLFLVDEGELHSTSFQKLRVLELENCEKFRFVFSSSIAKGLSLLEILEIKRCNNMGAIVVKEEKDGIEDGDVILFQQLQTLVLEGLPELVSFLSTRSSFMTDCRQIIAEGIRDLHMPLLHHQVSFPSLQTLRMRGLPKIKYVWSYGQEPKTVCRCLEQLKILEIEDCEVLEEIVAGGGGGGGEPVAKTILEFPRVTDLRLTNLKRLKWFYKRVHISKWPMLKEMWIEGCEKVKIFASGVVSFEETVKERSSEMSIKQPLFLVDELSFSSLKKLHIKDMYKLEIIWQDQVAASSFSKNIQDVEIVECEKLLHVFQSNFRTTTILTQRLTRLCIWDCLSLETIFRNMEGHNGKAPQVLIALSSGTEESIAREDGTARHIEFPILTQMILGELPKLKWILEGVHTNLECPSLESLELWECDQVLWASKFASNSSSQETSQQKQLQTCIQLPLPNLLELQVWYSGREEIFPYELVDPVPRLRRLELRSLHMLTHLWKEDSTQPCPLFHNLEFLTLSGCDKLKNIVPSSVFLQNLTELDISDCDGLINLLTSSTAKTLVQLKEMTLMKCKRITEIVAMEDGEANVAITFNKLAYLKLAGLPKLTHFCSGSYSFGFPSLKEVSVRRCPEMKPFWDGVSSTTPELRVVYLT